MLTGRVGASGVVIEMGPTYAQAYRKSWESFPDLKDWLRPVESDKTKAYCLYCKCEITAKLSDVRRHTSSVKHVRAAEPVPSCSSVEIGEDLDQEKDTVIFSLN